MTCGTAESEYKLCVIATAPESLEIPEIFVEKKMSEQTAVNRKKSKTVETLVVCLDCVYEKYIMFPRHMLDCGQQQRIELIH